MIKIFAGLAAAALVAAAPAAAVTAFASFNGVNGNGGFTYGFTDGTTLTPFNTSQTGAACALSGATCLTSSLSPVLPFASVGGSFPTVNVPSDAIVVHPGDSDALSAYGSYTAGSLSRFSYSIDVQSRGIDTTNGIGYRSFSAIGGVVTLGARTVIPTYLGTGNISGITTLAAGQQFGFIIDRNGGYGGDSTGVNLTINAVPEPASWGLMIVGFGLIGAVARRRAAAIAA